VTEAFDDRSFTERVFEEKAAAVAAALVMAGQKAHDRSAAAQHGSELKTKQPYGNTYWLALPEEVIKRVQGLLEGAASYDPEGAQYKLIVWNDILILPVKVLKGRKSKGRLRIRTSHLRETLTRVNMPDAPEAHLFINDEEKARREFEEAAIAVVEEARQDLGNIVSHVIIAAYECNHDGGLQTVRVGVGNLDLDGYIDFTDSERLSLVPPVEGTKPVEAAGESWSNAPKPTPNLEPLDDEVTATGEDEPVAGPDPDNPENPGKAKAE
jgi:hypothetical protein